MKFFKLFLLLFLALQINSEQPKNILFVGNSYLYYNNSVHNYVEPMLKEHYGSEVETKLSAIGVQNYFITILTIYLIPKI